MDEIRVLVVNYPDRKCLMMRYRDPLTRKLVAKSSGTDNRREAEREAAKWEAELREGRYHAPLQTTWEEFRQRYSEEHIPSLSPGGGNQAEIILDVFQREIIPRKLSDVNAARISEFQTRLRSRGLSEHTIKSYLGTLRAALGWAHRVGMLAKVPRVEMPKRARGSKLMKGRPITTEEFERMLAKVSDVVGEAAAPAWRRYLRGLWLSGLRLAESLELTWDNPRKLCLDFDGKRPMLRIPAALEKGNRDRLLPMAPEFAEFLAETPEDERSGYVFDIRGRTGRFTPQYVGRITTRIGRAAGVKVDDKPGRVGKGGKMGPGRVKWASAHDLRRAFGYRWSSRVMPAVLQQLMRHESVETTLRFYVGKNAEATADVLWAAYAAASGNGGNTLGNTPPKTAIFQDAR